MLRSGGLGVRDLTRTAALLDLDEAHTATVIETAYAAGLLAADGEVDEAWCPTPAYDLWADRPGAEQWTLLAQAWLAMTRTPALDNERDASGSRVSVLSREAERSGTPDARRSAVEALAGLPVGASPVRDDLVALLEWQRPRRRSPLRRLVSEATLAEAEQLGVTGLGALSSVGRVLLATTEVEESAVEARAAARAPGRAPVARAVVDALQPLLPAAVDHVLLQADLTAVAPGPLEPGLARELALLADVESTGGATVAGFTEATVRRALDAGRAASDLLALLTERSRTPVPRRCSTSSPTWRAAMARYGSGSPRPTSAATTRPRSRRCWQTAAPPRSGWSGSPTPCSPRGPRRTWCWTGCVRRASRRRR